MKSNFKDTSSKRPFERPSEVPIKNENYNPNTFKYGAFSFFILIKGLLGVSNSNPNRL